VDERKIWSWNANGLREKIEWLRTAVRDDKDSPAFILVQETHIDTEASLPTIEGYLSRHAGAGNKEAGVAIYHRQIMPVEEHTEGTPRRITIKTGTTAIINVYAPVNSAPRTTREEFYEEITAEVQKLQSKGYEVIIAGDFNAQLAGQGHKEDNANGRIVRTMMTACQ
jgi:exonuclease III